MSRFEFIAKLESLLLDIPLDERQEALQYYNDYFEEAGKDHEEDILNDFGSPERIAAIIKADLNSNASENGSRGYFTENGYQDTVYKDPKFEIIDADYKEAEEIKEKIGEAKYYHQTQAENKEPRKDNQEDQSDNRNNQYNNNTRIALIIILCIFAIPVGIPILAAGFSIAFSIIAVVFSLFLGFGISGVVCVIVGIALIVLGIIKLVAIPLLGMLLCGSGLIVLGIGMMFVLLSVALCKNLLPALVRGVVNFCKLPFKNRSVAA